jgi:hypothetical protein
LILLVALFSLSWNFLECCILELWPSSGILKNTAYWKLDLLINTELNHWVTWILDDGQSLVVLKNCLKFLFLFVCFVQAWNKYLILTPKETSWAVILLCVKQVSICVRNRSIKKMMRHFIHKRLMRYITDRWSTTVCC